VCLSSHQYIKRKEERTFLGFSIVRGKTLWLKEENNQKNIGGVKSIDPRYLRDK